MSNNNGNLRNSEAARQYHQRGWVLVPISINASQPLPFAVRAGQDQELDPWQDDPEANIGLQCGASGLIGIEVGRGQMDQTGYNLLEQLSEAYNPPTIDSPNGGKLMLFEAGGWQDSDLDMDLPQSIRIHAGDAIVPLPPSVNAEGARYRWIEGHDPEHCDLVAVPEDEVQAAVQPPVQPEWLTEYPSDQLLEEPADYGDLIVEPGEGEEGDIDDSFAEYQSPLDLEPPKNLDLGLIDEYASFMADVTGSPLEFNRLGGLMLFATAIQERAILPMRFGRIRPNLYGVIVARSSVYSKTTSMRKVWKTLEKAQLERLLLAAQMSPEGLILEMSERRHGLIVRDEIGTLFADKKGTYLADLKQIIMQLYDGDTFRKKLTKGEFEIKEPCLSLLGATTPVQFYENISHREWNDGFLARFLFVLPESEPDFDSEPTMELDQADKKWQEFVGEIKRLSSYSEATFSFESGAYDYWRSWYKTTMKAADQWHSDVVATFAKRYTTVALKFSMILAAANGSWGSIDLATMETAIQLADSYKRYVHRLLTGRDRHKVTGEKLQKVLSVMQERAEGDLGTTKSKLLQFTNMDKSELDPVIEELLRMGACTRVDTTKGKGERYRAVKSGPLPIRPY